MYHTKCHTHPENFVHCGPLHYAENLAPWGANRETLGAQYLENTTVPIIETVVKAPVGAILVGLDDLAARLSARSPSLLARPTWLLP